VALAFLPIEAREDIGNTGRNSRQFISMKSIPLKNWKANFPKWEGLMRQLFARE
jgi:hypothetical protein